MKALSASIPPMGDRAIVRTLLDRVRAQRVARDWSQAEMAARVGVSKATYQNFEGGFANISLRSLMRILGVLGFSQNLADLVPEVEAVDTLETVGLPPRRRARAKPRKKEDR